MHGLGFSLVCWHSRMHSGMDSRSLFKDFHEMQYHQSRILVINMMQIVKMTKRISSAFRKLETSDRVDCCTTELLPSFMP